MSPRARLVVASVVGLLIGVIVGLAVAIVQHRTEDAAGGQPVITGAIRTEDAAVIDLRLPADAGLARVTLTSLDAPGEEHVLPLVMPHLGTGTYHLGVVDGAWRYDVEFGRELPAGHPVLTVRPHDTHPADS